MSSSGPQPYEEARKFRKTERGQSLETLRELIEESRKRAKSHYTPSKERAKWVKLTGQLLWYRDQVLRSLGFEALEEEVSLLKAEVMKKREPMGQMVGRRTISTGTVETSPNPVLNFSSAEKNIVGPSTRQIYGRWRRERRAR